MQHMEGLQNYTELDLSMGYYIIDIFLESHDLMTIVTEFGKFRYTRLPMGIFTSGDIFKDKVDKILDDIEDVKKFTNDILVLTKEIFFQHILQIRVIFNRLHAVGLKVNLPKCSFGLK